MWRVWFRPGLVEKLSGSFGFRGENLFSSCFSVCLVLNGMHLFSFYFCCCCCFCSSSSTTFSSFSSVLVSIFLIAFFSLLINPDIILCGWLGSKHQLRKFSFKREFRSPTPGGKPAATELRCPTCLYWFLTLEEFLPDITSAVLIFRWRRNGSVHSPLAHGVDWADTRDCYVETF